MSPADALNARLQAAHPAAASLLSDVGRRIFFPRGVPAQSADARHCRINATIGQYTDGRGGAAALRAIRDGLGPDVSLEAAVLYPAQGGVPALRDTWRARLAATAGNRIGRPLVTAGLTQGLATVADLFVDADTDVILPDPCWGNYRLIFGVRRAGQLLAWPVLDGDGVNIDGLRSLLAARSRKTVLVLNFPSNPVGFSPTIAETQAIVDALASCPVPLVVVTDDAYMGMVWDDTRMAGSLFDPIVRVGMPHVLPIKIDGATKELFFFGGRVGFLTFGVDGDAAAVLEDKAMGTLRATTSTSSAPGQALVLQALLDPELPTQRAEILERIRARHDRLRDGLSAAGIETMPFNAAFFILVKVRGDAEAARKALLSEGVGVVSFPSASALRVSYASVALDDIDDLVAALARHV
ncbi:MAG: aminotransferase class I/II-fold pyridoxal phosphate-dependent enzyme [Myxococcota bacterium]|nr:aminotransferase class I/II-fold pyridoxal phosphate-dependent enzyme [Myxococcota bacterium]